jgi:hypothetical protein
LKKRLEENIGSVRESAAIALVSLAHILKNEDYLKEFVKNNLLKAKEQRAEIP